MRKRDRYQAVHILHLQATPSVRTHESLSERQWKKVRESNRRRQQIREAPLEEHHKQIGCITIGPKAAAVTRVYDVQERCTQTSLKTGFYYATMPLEVWTLQSSIVFLVLVSGVYASSIQSHHWEAEHRGGVLEKMREADRDWEAKVAVR